MVRGGERPGGTDAVPSGAPAAPVEPITVCLVGCGKHKLTRRAPARELYTGSLFRAARRYAEQCDAWFILSAKYHLVHPDTVLAPYNQRLRASDASRWALVCCSGIGHQVGGVAYRVILLCGADYARPVRAQLEAWGKPVEEPLAGLGLGRRLQWLKREADAFAEAVQ